MPEIRLPHPAMASCEQTCERQVCTVLDSRTANLRMLGKDDLRGKREQPG